MSDFKFHTLEDAPEQSKPILEKVKARYGFVPNLFGGMAASPAVAEAYLELSNIYAKSSLSDTERQIVMMTANRLNGCTYCMAAHSMVARKSNIPADVIEALRQNTPIADAKLEALRQFSAVMVENRGWPSDADVKAFLEAGYERAHVLEVILGLSLKTLSNYSNHVMQTPVDDVFASETWEAPAVAAE